MTPEEAHKAILQEFISRWHTLAGGTQNAPTVPYAIDNRRLQQPTPPFARVEIVNLDSDQVTMGRPPNRRFERMGFIDVYLYDKPGVGRGGTDVLVSYVRTIYESKSIGVSGGERGVHTYALKDNEVRGDKEYPDLWCVLARTPFWYHERR